jgi:hypothetical protein
MEPNLQPDHCDARCCVCHDRIPEGEELVVAGDGSWGARIFCSPACQALQDTLRL